MAEFSIRSNREKVAAISLFVGAFLTLLLTHTSTPLSPIRLIVLVLVAFAVWAFSDEMGIKKPLNRGAFVLFSLAVMAKAQIIVGIPLEYVARYYLLYAAFLLLAVLLWSIAFLHRDKTLKVIGSIGLLASFLPILAIVVGHVVVGFGATLGAGALLSAMEGGNTADLSFVITVERIFGVWAYVAALLIWFGKLKNTPHPTLA